MTREPLANLNGQQMPLSEVKVSALGLMEKQRAATQEVAMEQKQRQPAERQGKLKAGLTPEREAEVQPDRVSDDHGREAMAFVAGGILFIHARSIADRRPAPPKR